jgi:hypothetical protein
MMGNPVRRFLLCPILLLLVAPAHGGAWLQPEGRAYVRLSGGLLSTDERFDADGHRVPFDDAGGFRSTDYQDLLVVLYAEMGIHRDWTLLFEGTLKSVTATQNSAVYRSRGTGDLGVGVKRKLWRNLWNVGAVTGFLRFPTGYDETDYPSVGSGVTDLGLVFQAGASTFDFWMNLDLSFVLRGGNFRDQTGAALTGGWKASRRIGLRGEVRGGIPVGGLPPASTDSLAPFDPNGVDPRYLDLAATLSVQVVRGVSVEAEVRSTVAGENTLRGTRFGFALATTPSVRLWGDGW